MNINLFKYFDWYSFIIILNILNANRNLLNEDDWDDYGEIEEPGVEDFVFIDHSFLDSQRSSILRNIKVLVLEYHHLSNSEE